MTLSWTSRKSLKQRLRRAVPIILFTALVSLGCTLYFLQLRAKNKPSTAALLLRVRPNATEDNQRIYLLTSASTILSEMKALGWKIEINSIGLNNSQDYPECNGSGLIVPNVVHYVWLGTDLDFTFINYLSFRSVHRFIRPQFIFVYGEQGPRGTWWERTVKEVDNIYHVFRAAPLVAPSGNKFKYKAHASDLLRTQIICGKYCLIVQSTCL